MTRPVLFFCVNNEYCRTFYLNYIKHMKKNVKVVDLTLGGAENKALQALYNVGSVPTVILLKSDLKSIQYRWSGGKPPDLKKIQMELVMRFNYG